MTISEAHALTQGYDRLDELIQIKDQQLMAVVPVYRRNMIRENLPLVKE